MARFYSRKDMLDILKRLDISPVDGAISTEEAAKVLTWRAKDEQGIDYTYKANTVRSRVHTNSLVPVGGKRENSRYNTYKIEDVFSLPLFPTRGKGQKRAPADAA